MGGAYLAETITIAENASGQLATGLLMQRAAAGIAATVFSELKARGMKVYGAAVLAIIGTGGNGADGAYAVARLAARGVRVTYWLAGGAAQQDALAALRACSAREVSAEQAMSVLLDTDMVLDAFSGLGSRPGLPATVSTFAKACRDLDIPVISVDFPSGLVADENQAHDSFAAATSVTFGGRRYCHVMEPARSLCGRIEVIDIGIELGQPDIQQWGIADLAACLPVPTPTADKYSRGVVGINAGSHVYVGAGVLCATGAVFSGAGMVRFMGPKVGPVRVELPNVLAGEGRVDSWVLGSGWGGHDGMDEIRDAMSQGVPIVLDADALVPQNMPQKLRPDVLLTPHAGELARMLGCSREHVTDDPLAAVAEAVQTWGATVLLKGATQYVASPGSNTVSIAISGPGWTAQAGSGDILAGMCGTFLAAGLSTPVAALCAASLQALAADRMAGPNPPQVVARALPELIAELIGGVR
ncbi:MAG: bifunctional ADP-dependent NAD(P)H-hydrate dehydratase/NAD(P)H-hydrate epimerase [Propionibacteriaceae bacterium]